MEKWENPEVINENRLESHAIFQEDCISLNGRWRFMCTKANEELPEQFYEPTFSSKHWEINNVPSSWESSGHSQGFFYADRPSSGLSFRDRKTPSVDSANNLIGIYRKRFQIQDNWIKRKVVLRFSDVRSAFCVWLNGAYLGMSKGSLTPVEFDISQNVQVGYNYICVQVSQFSDASRLEHPGSWVLSGILGDVDVYTLPHQRITDLYAEASFGDSMSDVQLSVTLKTEEADGLTARIAVMEDNKVCYYGEGIITDGETRVLISCKNASLWSAESPTLYKIAVILWDGVAICHTRQIDFGFREVGIDHTSLTLNGQPLTIKGVCYPCADSDSFEDDIKSMKACNINAVRVFPPISEKFYDLCDRYGLYVLDDCAAEQASTGDQLQNVQSVEMVTAHRNHPCIIMWNLSCSRETIAHLDKTRPVCNEDFYCVSFPDLQRVKQMELLEDIVETPTGLARVLSSPTVIPADHYSSLPLLALSFGGKTGNSAQQLIAYADVFRKSKHWCGGFFWNFKDQDIYPCTDPKCAAGLVDKKGVPHHNYYELQKAYQWIRCQRNEDGSICIKNHHAFRSTQEFACSYQITRDGSIIDEDTLDLNIPPRGAQTIRVPVPDSMYLAGRYYLTIRFQEKEDAILPGATTAYFQWELANNRHISEIYPGGTIRDDGTYISLKAENFTFTLNRNTGNLDQISVDETPLLADSFSPAFYRVKTDSEIITSKRLDDWAKMTLKNQFPKPSVVEVDHMAHQITIMQNVGAGLMRRYQLNRDGSLTVEMRLRTGKNAPNRIGMHGALDLAFQNVSWMGVGPWDTYCDRNGYGLFALHHQTADAQDEHFCPQEHGNKTNVFRFSITNSKGAGIQINSDEPFECSVWPYTLSNLQNGDRTPTQTVFNVNCIQNGLEEVVIKPHSTYTYSFTIKPLQGE